MTMKYGDVVAVRDLSLDILKGEMMVLLGPSGCGKTSTMRSIVGLETPARGSIRIGDQTVFDADRGVNVPVNKRNIGMVFQSYAIWPHKTVFQNVAFPLRMEKVDKSGIRERVEATLQTVGLKDFGKRGASMLSGGQMQRVALARSLVSRPRVLLLDEPLSNLDARLRDSLRFELKELQQDIGLTTIYVTHDQSEALALADRIAVMRDGEIAQLEDPVTLYTRPNSTFVADFLGVSNLFRGEVTTRDGARTTVHLADVGEDMVVEGLDASSGTAVALCIRPEAMHIGTEPPASAVNVWRGRVEVASFLGSHVRYQVASERAAGLDVIDHSPERWFTRGDDVHIFVHPADVHVIREPSPHALPA